MWLWKNHLAYERVLESTKCPVNVSSHCEVRAQSPIGKLNVIFCSDSAALLACWNEFRLSQSCQSLHTLGHFIEWLELVDVWELLLVSLVLVSLIQVPKFLDLVHPQPKSTPAAPAFPRLPIFPSGSKYPLIQQLSYWECHSFIVLVSRAKELRL